MSSAIEGGNFKDWLYGAIAASGIASATRYAYSSIVGYEVNTAPGGAAVDKEANHMPSAGANNVGEAGKVGRAGDRWQEGGARSSFLNGIHGINAVAGLHDVMQVLLDRVSLRSVLNYPGMVPAAFITYMAVIDQIPGPALQLNPQ